MWKAALVGAVAFAAIGTTSISAETLGASGSGIVVTSSHISQLKSMLQLKPAQERYWPAVEAALRSLTRQSAGDDNDGFVQKARARAAAITANASGVRRVWAAARPLIRTLDEEQKQSVIMLARSLGISHLASAL